MPFTKKEVRFLLSKGSPLSEDKKAKIKAELASDPSLGRAKKGSKAMKRPKIEMSVSGHDWRQRESDAS